MATSHFIYCSASETFRPQPFPEALWTCARGVMTTFVLAYPVFHLEAHFNRLQAGAQAQEMTLPWPQVAVWTDFIAMLGSVSPEVPSVVRVCVAQNALAAQTIWVSFRSVPPKEAPLKLSTCHYDRLLPAHKTLYDLVWADTLLELKAAGVDEALRVNSEGHVAEAIYANVFGLDSDGSLVTPVESTGCLLGTMRRAVLAEAQKKGLVCREVCEPIAYFEALPGLFLTNAVRGLRAVGELNGTRYEVAQTEDMIARLALNPYESSSFS